MGTAQGLCCGAPQLGPTSEAYQETSQTQFRTESHEAGQPSQLFQVVSTTFAQNSTTTTINLIMDGELVAQTEPLFNALREVAGTIRQMETVPT